MTSKRVQAMVLATAAVAGYAGAAAITAAAAPALPSVAVASDFGPGDGLTRYALTAQPGALDDGLLAALDAVPGVASAQSLGDGRALVAADGVTPERLGAVAGVAAVEISPSVPVLGTVSDPYFPQYGWNLENTGSNFSNQPVAGVADADVDATAGWETSTGEGRIVAVVDTGFDSDHPELSASLWTNPDEDCGGTDTDGNGLAGDCHGWNFYANSAHVDNGSMGTHGTSVAGVVGSRAGNGIGTAGVAPGVTMMPLVIGGGDSVDVNLGAQAIRYAVDHGADVITASWGGRFTGAALQGLKDAVGYAAAHDVVVVAAAGNDAANRDTDVMYPASLPDPNVITVGNSTAGDTVSPSSAYGAASIDLFAPGHLVLTTWNDGGFRLVSGTSIAGPQVAAAYALYRAQRPDAGYPELKQALLDDVDPVPAFVGKSVTGGRLTMSRLTGTPAESASYAFTSMTSPAGVVSPVIGVTGPTTPGDYEVVLGLGMEHAGEIWALANKAVTLGGVTVTTDDAGDAVFPLGALPGLDGTALAPSTELGDGRYVLTVQTYRDGAAVGRTYAAPLLVGTAVPAPVAPSTPGSTSPDGSTPDGTTPGGSTPGGSTPGGATPPGPGTVPTAPGGGGLPSTPGTGGSGSAPGTTPGADSGSAPSGTTPGGSSPGGSAPGGTNPGTTPPGTTDPGTTDPGTTSPAPTTPSTPTPGSPTPGTTPPGTTDPGTSTPGTPVPGTTTYPEVGAFRITSLSPNVVDSAGGTVVTITGLALPANPTVRIGATATATVVTATTTRVTFRVPARIAGRYDVSVFAPDGRSAVLSSALTYADAVGTAPGGSTPGSTTPGGTPPGGTTPGGSTPGGSTPVGPTPGDGSTPSTGPVVRSGPAGERLVRSAKFGAVRPTIWSVNCSSSCTGVAI